MRQQVRVLVNHFARLAKRVFGFGQAPLRLVGACQADPAGCIVRVGLQARSQAIDHLVDLLRCHAGRCGWINRRQFACLATHRRCASSCRQTGFGAGVGNIGLHLLRVRRSRVQHRQQLFPLGHGQLEVGAAIGGNARHHQAHRMLRVQGQCLVDHFQRLAFNVVVGAHCQQIGVIDQQIRFGIDQVTGLLERLFRFGEASHHLVGTRQHGPALGVIRLFLQACSQLVDHLRNLVFAGFLRCHRVDRLRRTQPPVHARSAQRQQQRNQDGGTSRGEETLPSANLHRGWFFGVVEQTQLQLVLVGFAVSGRDDAARQIALQRFQLIAVDRSVQALAGNTGAIALPQQWTHQPGQCQQCQYHCDCDKCGHEGVPVSLRRACAFLRWSGSSAAGVAPRWLRRTVRTSTTMAATSSMKGPNQSIHVTGLKGGL